MHTSSHWIENCPLSELRAAEFEREGVVFRWGQNLYRTTGERLSFGGMGSVVVLERMLDDGGVESVVAKTFHSQYLYQLRTDEITRRDHQTNLHAVEVLRRMDHPHLLPIYVSAAIADNYVLITPRMGETLFEAALRGKLSPRMRVSLLIQALQGLSAMHEQRLLHRDFTLRNILLNDRRNHAYLFDYDLALSLDDVSGMSYQAHYKGRIFGSPGYSVPPEVVEPSLMECAITPRLDIYGIGGAVFGLFTDQTPHGPADDMWALLVRIGEGVVSQGVSRVKYPAEVPEVLRPIIERCLERDPGERTGSVRLVIRELQACLDTLPDDRSKPAFIMAPTLIRSQTEPRDQRVQKVHAALGDSSINRAVIEMVDMSLSRYGYQIERSLGQVKSSPIFIAVPNPELVTSGQFSDTNTYPKVVTAINLGTVSEPQTLLSLWFGRYLPVLHTVRQGTFTNLYRVVYDEHTQHLLLFSEYVDEARFGTDLYQHVLSPIEALGLGFVLVRQVARLHEHGLAHNNIRPESLLLKGIADTHDVYPSMAGLVEPSVEPEALTRDVRSLATMVRSWLSPQSSMSADQRVRSQMDELRSRLSDISMGARGQALGIDELVALFADGLSAVDYNFGVLRENGGDLEEYVLLQLSHRLYHRLW